MPAVSQQRRRVLHPAQSYIPLSFWSCVQSHGPRVSISAVSMRYWVMHSAGWMSHVRRASTKSLFPSFPRGVFADVLTCEETMLGYGGTWYGIWGLGLKKCELLRKNTFLHECCANRVRKSANFCMRTRFCMLYADWVRKSVNFCVKC